MTVYSKPHFYYRATNAVHVGLAQIESINRTMYSVHDWFSVCFVIDIALSVNKGSSIM